MTYLKSEKAQQQALEFKRTTGLGKQAEMYRVFMAPEIPIVFKQNLLASYTKKLGKADHAGFDSPSLLADGYYFLAKVHGEGLGMAADKTQSAWYMEKAYPPQHTPLTPNSP